MASAGGSYRSHARRSGPDREASSPSGVSRSRSGCEEGNVFVRGPDLDGGPHDPISRKPGRVTCTERSKAGDRDPGLSDPWRDPRELWRPCLPAQIAAQYQLCRFRQVEKAHLLRSDDGHQEKRAGSRIWSCGQETLDLPLTVTGLWGRRFGQRGSKAGTSFAGKHPNLSEASSGGRSASFPSSRSIDRT
jgi:hypothetical protein